MHPGIKLRHIRAFLDTVEAGSITAAARRQGISQPALSRTLAELETLLGRPLFDRQGRRLSLSQGGQLFRRHALAGLQAFEAGAAALSPGGDPARLRVGLLPTVAGSFFPAVALRLRALSPELLLSVETGPHHHLIRALRDGAIDVMVGRMPAAADMAGLSFTHLYEDRIALVSRPDHPGAGGDLRAALARYPLILPPETALIRPPVMDFLAAQGLATLRPAIETVSPPLALGLLAGSDALWFISHGVVSAEVARGAVAEWPTGAGYLAGSVGYTRRPGGGGPALDRLTDLLAEAAARLPSAVGPDRVRA